MEKIIKALLSEKFKGGNVEALLEVVNATSNPQIATEILCGLYEAPALRDNEIRISKENGELELIRYDKWSDKVTYEYEHDVTKGFYISKDVDRTMVTIENYRKYETSTGQWMTLKTGERKRSKSDMYLESWLQLPVPQV